MRQPVLRPAEATVRAPVEDAVMGPLSGLARQIVAGLEDPAVRGDVVRAMKDPATAGRGLDLMDCGPGTVVERLLARGEARGGQRAAALCGTIQRSEGMILYMDRDRLAGWDSTTIPVVTAIASPDGRLPAAWRGYRSAERTIDVARDGSLGGPIFVVLPYLHPTRFATRSFPRPNVNLIRVKSDSPGRVIRLPQPK